jgi:prephenate dehydratase
MTEQADLGRLPSFPSASGLLEDPEGIARVLRSSAVKEVRCFALGPEGTNIAQACRLWLRRNGIEDKSTVILCPTPEDSVIAARRETAVDRGILGLFWTCAVFDREKEVFFENPDVYPFFVQETMLLDEMQLAAHPELIAESGGAIPEHWRIASHPSPAPLLAELPNPVVRVRSNADAAARCAAGEFEACITTESARQIHGLIRLHVFGCPPMVFFGGITAAASRLFRQAQPAVVWEDAAVLTT